MTQNRLYPSAAAIAALVIVFLFTSNSFAQAPTVNQPYRLSSGAETVIGSVKLTSDNLYSVYVEGDLRVQEGALFSVRLIDGVRRRLSPPLGPDERVFDFRISSDNATVAFVVDNSRTEGKTLYRVDVDGSNREIIAGPLDRPLDSISFLQYVFANNGQHILYQLFGGPLKGLYAVSSAGGDSTRLDPPVANPGGFLRLFAGTNNIDFALFSANLAEGGVGIYKVSFNGGEVEKISAPVANTLQRIQKTEVSADGNYVVYAINGLGGAEMQLISIDLRTNQTRVISGPIDSRITSLAAESLYFDGNSKVVYRTRALSFSPVTLNAYWVTPLDGSEPAQPLSTPLTESQGIGSVVERSATDQHFYYSTFTPGSDGAAATEKIFRANVLNQSVVEIQSMVDSRTFQGNLVESSDFATVLISSFVGPTRPQRNQITQATTNNAMSSIFVGESPGQPELAFSKSPDQAFYRLESNASDQFLRRPLSGGAAVSVQVSPGIVEVGDFQTSEDGIYLVYTARTQGSGSRFDLYTSLLKDDPPMPPELPDEELCLPIKASNNKVVVFCL